MPLYEFHCGFCDHSLTESRSIAERDLNPPMCQHGEAFHPATQPMRRVIGKTSFTLKGDGWYRDHYGLKAKNADNS